MSIDGSSKRVFVTPGLIGRLALSSKRALQGVVPSRLRPLLVASMGRSGSTMVFDALARGMAQARFGSAHWAQRRMCADRAFDLRKARIRAGVVYKTHGYPSEIGAGPKPKAIFIFGKASEAAVSVLACERKYGRPWVDQHLKHLQANGPMEGIAARDVMRIEDQLNAWIDAPTELPILAIRYEALWDNVDALSEFVGFPVSLPSRRSRESASLIGDETRACILRTYAELDKRIALLPDVSVRNSQH